MSNSLQLITTLTKVIPENKLYKYVTILSSSDCSYKLLLWQEACVPHPFTTNRRMKESMPLGECVHARAYKREYIL